MNIVHRWGPNESGKNQVSWAMMYFFSSVMWTLSSVHVSWNVADGMQVQGAVYTIQLCSAYITQKLFILYKAGKYHQRLINYLYPEILASGEILVTA